MEKKKIKKHLKNYPKYFRDAALFYAVLLLILFSIPYIYDGIYGERTRTSVIDQVNASDPDEFALNLMDWERSHFGSPYFFQKKDKFYHALNIFKKEDGSYSFFGKGGPVSWTLHSELANCYEYADTFVTLMEERGFEARLVKAPGDDHVWAKYKSGDTWIAVDPSANRTVVRENMGERKDLSYVVSVNPETHEVVKKLTSRYAETENLTVQVSRDEKAVEGIEVEIRDPELSQEYERYDHPREMVEKTTGSEGQTSFVIANGNYILNVKKHLGPFVKTYSKNITVKGSMQVNFRLSNASGSWGLAGLGDSLTSSP